MILFYRPSHARRGITSHRSRNSGIEFYFTDHSLTGQSTSFVHCWVTSCNPLNFFPLIAL